jgi:hypothetical protein
MRWQSIATALAMAVCVCSFSPRRRAVSELSGEKGRAGLEMKARIREGMSARQCSPNPRPGCIEESDKMDRRKITERNPGQLSAK